MTSDLRCTRRLFFAALLALSLWLSATSAVADTRPFGLPNMFDPGSADSGRLLPQPLGHFGVTWE